ncbi:MAG: GIY-YIG nuclease family protein [Phycisphaerae bacterium]
MKSVYLLESESHAGKRYVGLTTDFTSRLAEHNAGKSAHTRAYVPRKPIVVVRFENNNRAEAFGRYLKSGSGHAFAKRHLW